MVTRMVAADNGASAILAMCVQAAVTGQQGSGVARDACRLQPLPTAVVSLPVQISRSGSTYTVRANTTVSKAHGGPLVASCQVKGNGLVIKLRARKRGRKLRSILGSKLGIGFSKQTGRSVGFRATDRFS